MSRAVTVLGRASRSRWWARRRKGITASDVPALLGLSPWSTPLGVWLSKVDARDSWIGGTYSSRRGHALEGFLAAEWAADNDATVSRPPALVAHPEHALLLASLDRYADTPTESLVLECKTDTHWRAWEDGDLPDQYAAQALMQACITGLPVVVVADVNGRMEVRRIERQPDWEAATIPVLLGWWQRHVVAGVPPPLDPYRDYSLLNRVWRPAAGEQVDATPAVLDAVLLAFELRERGKETDLQLTAARTLIREHMRTATVLTDPDTGATIARVDRRGALTVTYKPALEGIPA